MARKYLAVVLLLCAVSAGLAAESLPIRRSTAKIREVFLEAHPIGMPIEDFRRSIVAAKLKIFNEWDRASGTPMSPSKGVLKGRRVLMILLGSYQGIPLRADVIVYVGFTDGRLVDCFVEKQYDGL